LESHNISGALIGGAAIDAWAVARATQDIDFIIGITENEFSLILNIFQSNNFTIDEEWLKYNPAEKKMLRIFYNNLRFDFLFIIEPLLSEALNLKVKRLCFGNLRWVITPEYLIILKLRTARPRDIDDVINLVLYNKTTLNYTLLELKIKEYYLSKEWNYIISKII